MFSNLSHFIVNLERIEARGRGKNLQIEFVERCHEFSDTFTIKGVSSLKKFHSTLENHINVIDWGEKFLAGYLFDSSQKETSKLHLDDHEIEFRNGFFGSQRSIIITFGPWHSCFSIYLNSERVAKAFLKKLNLIERHQAV